MEFIAVLYLLLTTTIWGVTAKGPIIKCEEDHECGENRFCYLSGLCAMCIDCSVYSRKPHEFKSCAKSPTDCGDCFDGYTADILTEGKVREFCRPLSSAKNKIHKSGAVDFDTSWYYPVIIAIPTLSLLVILLLYCKYGARRAARNQLKPEQPATQIRYERPPPYFISGESPLLTRNTDGLHCQSYPAWQPDNSAGSNTTYQDKEHDMKLFVVQRTKDAVQQAQPFEYRPEDIKHFHAPSRTRSTCRPDYPRENYAKDDDDDNEDGLSVTHEGGTNGSDDCNCRAPTRTEHETQEGTEDEVAGKRKFVASDGGSSSHCRCDTRINLSSFSLCSESFVDSTHQGSKEHMKCSSEKNILKVFPLISKFDSGFISDSSSRLVEMNDNSHSSSSEMPNQFQFAEQKEVNVHIPVKINVFNTIVCL